MSVPASRWRLRPAVPADEDALCTLEREAFGARSWGADSVRGSLEVDRVAVVVGEAPGGGPMGFAMWRDLGGEAEILTIGVAPEARRAGLGALLLDAAATAARAAGAQRMFLEVDAGNEPAIRLYRNGGFVDAGLRKGYYRDGADAVIMALDLAPPG